MGEFHLGGVVTGVPMGPGGGHALAGCGAMGNSFATVLPPTVIAPAHRLRDTGDAP